MRSKSWYRALCAAVAVLAPTFAAAESTITVDGDPAEWDASDAQCLLNENESGTSSYIDAIRVCAVDDASSQGYFYMLIEFERSSGRDDVWLRNADVELAVDWDMDGVVDATIDFQSTPPDQVWGIIDLPYLEVRIDYDLVDPDGDGRFGFAMNTYWRSSPQDRVPSQDGSLVHYSKDPATGAPRAVRLLGVTAVADASGVRIAWATASERDNAGFLVERKAAGTRHFVPLDGFTPGLGNAPFGRRYAVRDPLGAPGDRYRIVDVDFDGRRTVHPPVTATEAPLADHLLPPMVSRTEHFDVARWLRRLFGAASHRRTDRTAALRWSVDATDWYFLADDALRSEHGVQGRFALRRDGRPLPVVRGQGGYYFAAAVRPDRYADFEVVTSAVGRPRPMPRRTARRCADPVAAVSQTAHFEEDRVYNVVSPTEDPFAWAMAYPGVPARVQVPLDDLAGAVHGVRIALSGFATLPGPDHQIAVAVNGGEPVAFHWEGKGVFVAALPGTDMAAGDNEITVTLAPDTYDAVAVDWIAVTYDRPVWSGDATAERTVASGTCLPVAPGLRAIDITRPDRPVLLRLPRRAGGFAVPGQGERRLLLTADHLAQTPVPEGPFAPVRLGRHAPDAVIITHEDVAPAAEDLALLYARRGAWARVVDVQRIYDRFSHGRPHPRAIRAFLERAAAHWGAAPGYVILFGSAAVDGNDTLGTGEDTLVPAPFYRTHAMGYEAASDWWYTENLPGAVVARFAVEDADQAQAVVDKLAAWGDAPAPEQWVTVLDKGATAAESAHFQAAAQREAEALGFAPTILDVGAGAAAPDVVEALQSGSVLSYHGHAYLSGWSSPRVLDTATADGLHNAVPSAVFSWSCFDGAFVGPWDRSLAWSLVAAPAGGAAVVLAGASLSAPDTVDRAAAALAAALRDGAETVGAAWGTARARLAREMTPDTQDILATFHLLGDPLFPNPLTR